LTASATGTSQIGLSWTASTDNLGVTGYQVERCQGAACSNFALVATVTGASYNDIGLEAASTYRYQVRAADAAGNLSGYSAIAVATTQTTTDTTVPAVPTTLVATAASSSQIGLTWTASTDNVGVIGYRVERCQGVGCAVFTEVATVAGTGYNDTGVLGSTTYSYRLRAADASGNLSGYSDIAQATTQAPAASAFQFSTLGNTDPPGVALPADDADIYGWDRARFARVLDVSAIGVPTTALLDGLSIQGGVFYASFAGDVTIRGSTYQDEDILAYDPATDTWSPYFDGTARGLTAANQDIDDFDVVGSTLYFSTTGDTNPPGVSGTADNADVYSWNGTAFARVLDVSAIGIPTTASVDGLSVSGGKYYLSFAADVVIGGVTYQDEDILLYDSDTTTWSLYFDGTAPGLTANNQDIDAVDIP
jgi:chitodextrinase